MNLRTAVARVAIAVAAVFAVVGGGATARAAVPAQTTSTAVVIVDTGSGVHQTVVHFDGTTTGLGALQLAGANPETINYGGSLGQAVCKLYGVGDEPVPSQCPGGWVYYRAVGGAGGWTQSSQGASNTTVHDGDVEGWKYGGGQPPFSSFCSVVGCAPPPTDAPPPTAAPTAAPSAGGTSGDGTTNGTPSATVGTTAPRDAGDGSKDATVEGATASKGTTTTTGRSGEITKAHRHDTDGAQLAAGSRGNGGDGGSPIGVIVALAIVAAGVVGGLWLRRRRRGPAPG
jgi:hypothetical protein